MLRRTGERTSIGLMTTVAVAAGTLAAVQVPSEERATAVPVAVGSGATPAELQAWDARIDGMLRTGELVVASRTNDPVLPGRTHEYAAQLFGGLPVLGAGVTRQFDRGVTVSAFGTLHENLALGAVPALTAAEAGVRLEQQTGARLGDGQQPELMVLPRPDRFLCRRLRCRLRRRPLSLRERRRRPARALPRCDPQPVGDRHGYRDPRRPQEGERILPGQPLRSARPASPRRGRDPRRRVRRRAAQPAGDAGAVGRAALDVAGHRGRRGQRLGRHGGGRRPRPHGLDVRLLRPAARLGRRRRPPRPDHRHRQRLRRLQRVRRPPTLRPRRSGRVRLRALHGTGGAGRVSRSWRCTSSPTS